MIQNMDLFMYSIKFMEEDLKRPIVDTLENLADYEILGLKYLY